MALYFYQALSKEGKKVRGYLDASSLHTVKEQLSKQGLFPVHIEPAREATREGLLQRLFAKGVTEKDKILFTKQLAVLLRSGVPLLQAIELLVEQFEGKLHKILVEVKDDIKGGSSFAEALKKYPKEFDKIYVQLVRAGEAGGMLETILERLTSYLERRQAIAKKISSALQYPMMQLSVAGLVVGVLLTFVVPQMAENFAAQGGDLPGPTKFLLAVSSLFTTYWLPLIVVLIGVVVGFRYWRNTEDGARKMDQLKLNLPMIRYFSKISAVVQFCYTLGMLTEGGVNLSESLDIVCNIIDNRILADALSQARDKIIKQGKIAQYLQQTGIFPPIAIYLIRTGEESGQLGSMLLTVAQDYEVELAELADSLTAKMGPILLLVMAVIVGFIVISIALPIMKMGELAGGF